MVEALYLVSRSEGVRWDIIGFCTSLVATHGERKCLPVLTQVRISGTNRGCSIETARTFPEAIFSLYLFLPKASLQRDLFEP